MSHPKRQIGFELDAETIERLQRLRTKGGTIRTFSAVAREALRAGLPSIEGQSNNNESQNTGPTAAAA